MYLQLYVTLHCHLACATLPCKDASNKHTERKTCVCVCVLVPTTDNIYSALVRFVKLDFLKIRQSGGYESDWAEREGDRDEILF